MGPFEVNGFEPPDVTSSYINSNMYSYTQNPTVQHFPVFEAIEALCYTPHGTCWRRGRIQDNVSERNRKSLENRESRYAGEVAG